MGNIDEEIELLKVNLSPVMIAPIINHDSVG